MNIRSQPLLSTLFGYATKTHTPRSVETVRNGQGRSHRDAVPGKPPGGPAGHKGSTLKQALQQTGHIDHLLPGHCDRCHHELPVQGAAENIWLLPHRRSRRQFLRHPLLSRHASQAGSRHAGGAATRCLRRQSYLAHGIAALMSVRLVRAINPHYCGAKCSMFARSKIILPRTADFAFASSGVQTARAGCA